MASPTTPILDPGSRGSSENPLSYGGRWGGIVSNSAPSALQTDGSTIFSASGYGGATWQAHRIRYEAYMTRMDSTADNYLYWRIVPGTEGASTTTLACYMLNSLGGNAGIQMYRYDAGTANLLFNLGAGVTNNTGDQWFVTHDAAGLITAYLNGASVGSVTDNTYPAGGYLGLATNATVGGGFTNIGGGPITFGSYQFTRRLKGLTKRRSGLLVPNPGLWLPHPGKLQPAF